MCLCECGVTCIQRSEDNLQDPILSFLHVGAGDLTQVVSLQSKSPYPTIILLVLEFVFEGCSNCSSLLD